MKRIILLGATGSIGTSAADVVRTHRADFSVVAVTALSKRRECEALAAEFGAKAYVGEDAPLRAVEENEADLALVATVGESGVAPTMKAIEKGMDVALATKEVVVMHGEAVMRAVRERGVRMLPVDSEHSAIFQALQPFDCGRTPADSVEKLILTASGGPFLNAPADLSRVTVAEALNHPRWKMGAKVTVDSATMMNKGFEMMEAHWLFGVPVERIETVVHPESIVHSLVTFVDGSTVAQLAEPDMRVPIQYALTHPKRLAAVRRPLDLAAYGKLTFIRPDEERFPCLRLAREAIAMGGEACARLARADEKAVAQFLRGEIGFTDIPKLLESALICYTTQNDMKVG